MLRKLCTVLIALALPFLAASAAGAQQYPPTGDGPASTVPSERSGGSGGGSGSGAGGDSAAPLAATGIEATVIAGLGVVLLAGGGAALVLSRRRLAPTPG